MTNYPSAPHPQSGGAEVPTCPRHPDRVAYVRCQRCGRPACPECQRPAAVGIHCVDCVREANKASRAARTVFGGRLSSSGKPVATITLIATCAVMYLAGYVLPVFGWFAFSPAIGQIEPWRMLTTAFLHAGWLHLLVNMYALWIVGQFLEQMLGHWRYVALYLLSAFGGSVSVILLTPHSEWMYPVVGASGAVFGAFAAIAIVLKRTGRDARQILAVIAINAVISLVIARVSWQAHLGGLITGGILGLLFAYLPARKRTVGAVVGVAGLAVILAGITWLLYASA